MDNLEMLCTVKDACFTERAGRTTIHKRIKLGIFKAYKIGGSTRLNVASIVAYRTLMALPVTNHPNTAMAITTNCGGATHD